MVRGDLQLTLLDSLNKRLVFLRELCAALELPVTLIHARAEEGARQPPLREQFDVPLNPSGGEDGVGLAALRYN